MVDVFADRRRSVHTAIKCAFSLVSVPTLLDLSLHTIASVQLSKNPEDESSSTEGECLSKGNRKEIDSLRGGRDNDFNHFHLHEVGVGHFVSIRTARENRARMGVLLGGDTCFGVTPVSLFSSFG